MATELWRLGAADLAQAIRERQVSSREVMQAHLERIDIVNSRVNALTVVLRQEALQAAEAADKAVSEGTQLGPLHGVPITIKENIDLAGSATTQGLAALRDAIAQKDAPHIAQLRHAGAIPIGRTNLPDLALRWHTHSEIKGATRNPWNPAISPGGSSGGEAAALATGMTPLGFGNDIGGSLRYPSQCCGTTAIRPSRGRVPWASSLDPFEFPITFQLFYVQGPMARHVRDLRIALNVISGPDARDPWWTPAPLEGPALSKPVRVAVTFDPGKQGIDPGVAAGVREAAQILADAGYAVEEVEPPAINEAAALWRQLIAAEIRTLFLPFMKQTASAQAVEFLNLFLAALPEGDLRTYMEALAERNRVARQWTQFAQKYPLILGPISTLPPMPVGYDLAGATEVEQLVRSMRLVTAINLLGLPSAAVPVSVADQTPRAVQIIGPMYREDLCLNAAETLEKRLGVLTPIDPRS